MIIFNYQAEISLNSLQNPFGLFFAKTLEQPFNRIAIVLTAIAMLARRQNVIRSIFATFGLWNKVFSMQGRIFVEQGWGISTKRTNPMKVIESEMPISFRKSRFQMSFLRTPSLRGFSRLLAIIPPPLLNAPALFIWVFLNPSTFLGAYLFRFGLKASPPIFSLLIGAEQIIVSLSFAHLAQMFFFVALITCLNFIWVFLLPSSNACSMAPSANSAESIPSFVQTKELSGGSIPLCAFRAGLEGKGNIKHDAFLSSNSMMLSAGGGISRFSGIGLSDNNKFYHIPRSAANQRFSTNSRRY